MADSAIFGRPHRRPGERPVLWQEHLRHELEAALAADPVVLVPTGSVEQHGPHGPLDVDTVTAHAIAVAAAEQCEPAALASAIGLLQAAGFAVSRFLDVPGLAVMRTVAMLANEAADAVNQGVCSESGADQAMRLGVNYPQGPLAWADRVGVAGIRDVLANLGASYGEDRYRVSPLIRRACFAGRNIHG